MQIVLRSGSLLTLNPLKVYLNSFHPQYTLSRFLSQFCAVISQEMRDYSSAQKVEIKGVMIPFQLIRTKATLYVTGSGGSKLLDLTKWQGWRKP